MRRISPTRTESSHRRLRRGVGIVAAGLLLLAVLLPAQAGAQSPPPPNDNIANAEAATAGDLLLVNTVLATTETDEPVPSCAPPGDPPIRRTVWYTVTAHDSTLRFSAFGSATSFRPILALYLRGGDGLLSLLGCSTLGELTADVVSGQSYLLQVGGFASFDDEDSGRLSLLVGPVVGSLGTSGGNPVICAPRPRVILQVAQAGPGRLSVTIQTTTNAGSAPNALQDARVTSTTNAVVDVPNGQQGASGVVVLPLAAGTQNAQFTLRRSAPGAFTANLTVTDACGAWPTFVGGGTGVP